MLNQPIRRETCTFDVGADYIEVHHITPLHAAGPSETPLGDLALLCANCHRMCHRNYTGEAWRTPDDLREKMRAVARHAASPAS
ncbi:HNH endonuclease [Streptomyces sp. NPDC051822]